MSVACANSLGGTLGVTSSPSIFLDSSSVVKFQSKLNLPRIIRGVASRSNFAKGVAGEIARSRDRNHAVAAKVRSAKVRVVEEVEELRPEFQPEALTKLYLLEHREVHTLESR